MDRIDHKYYVRETLWTRSSRNFSRHLLAHYFGFKVGSKAPSLESSPLDTACPECHYK